MDFRLYVRRIVWTIFVFCGSNFAGNPRSSEVPPLAYPVPTYKKTVSGRAVNPDGTPAAGAVVGFRGWWQTQDTTTTTDKDGRFRLDFQVLGKARDPDIFSTARFGWQHSGYIKSADSRSEISPRQWTGFTVPEDPDVFQLVDRSKTRRPIKVRVLDEKERPIPLAKLILESRYGFSSEVWTASADGTTTVEVPRLSPAWEIHAYAPGKGTGAIGFTLFHSNPGIDGKLIESQLGKWLQEHREPLTFRLKPTRTVRVRVVDQRDIPLRGLRLGVGDPSTGSRSMPPCEPFSRTTDESGEATFDYLPTSVNEPIPFRPEVFGFTAIDDARWDPKLNVDEVTLRLARLVPVEGRTMIEGMPTEATVVAHSNDRSAYSQFPGGNYSGADGSFMLFLAPGKTYTLSANAKGHASRDVMGVNVDFDTPRSGIDIHLDPLAEIIVDLPDEIDLPEARNQNVGRLECSLYQCEGLPNRSFDDPAGKDGDLWLLSSMRTQSYGGKPTDPHREVFHLGPGHYVYFGEPWHEPQAFRVEGSESKAFVLKDPPGFPGQAVLKVAVKGAGRDDLHCYPLGQPTSLTIWRRSDQPGHFTLLRPKVRCLVTCGNAAAFVEADTESVELNKQQEQVSFSGRLIGLPPLRNDNRWAVRLHLVENAQYPRSGLFSNWTFVGRDENDFHTNRIPSGIPVELQISDGEQIWHTVAKLNSKESGRVELGDIEVDVNAIEEARNDPLEVALHTEPNGATMSRIQVGLAEARKAKKNLVVILGDPQGVLWLDLRKQLRKKSSFVTPFHTVALSVAPPFHIDSHGFVPWFDVSFAEARKLVVAVADPKDARLLARFKADDFVTNGRVDAKKLETLLSSYR